ncbi:MAG: ATP synthase epsilon chain [Candidatus Daviesbacteria bacterium GW2011_GWA1_41_61]|uniref:ATP synthase epsilon chain n=1 Tax=Candidatus Daviesbacteria bacterium GW2011_GWA2_40_9 TaxID=1618424 RepID=A0A0G0X835_9BACT|nr:MAG: ATP synthase epsilon chain [Candidatus Daviesbacteria bacterium GW2011_GWC1_40_9]KKR83812.1 MAG: ATP synthase epsilon chain [Candidatus Daviesbacteria bacterium GW2011_GWA2_40_9]KKR93421.1 MAG: ATP synthase epsilon chain [Candidatus Daviesbacteria bacterium GW2011_GWB1_41_15]KKS15030.1 MAG: ATP synthase epsilon chain [Candidatus Daviesbacteria bacterium GW2011_GWA1_41_61]
MSQLHLKIVTPEKEIYDGDVDMVTVTTPDGEIGLLPHHVNLMTQIIPGELRIKIGDKVSYMVTGSGLLQMVNNTLIIATDLAEKPEEIDEKAVEEAKKRAEAALEQTLTDEEYAVSLATVEKALAQLKVKRRHHIH